MRVLVTGSRDWEAECRVWEELDLVLQDAIEHQVALFVVHGDRPTGADRMARDWVERRITPELPVWLDQERHPADWNRFGRRAEFRRNAEMVNAGADVCLAFIRVCTLPNCIIPTESHGSHGAGHTMALAGVAGIEVREFREGW